ncbi:MAG: SRPBCC domain-containing protein [Chloroflexi bacterium]|nr:SRPBCC domain-containing protein [Chloroflexota bacterium]MDA1146868.1 SRPBCC domain-containing protein [Chloroflexota bacterium]
MTSARSEDGAAVVERYIEARPETVFALFHTREAWLSWQGVDATIEAHPGGAFRIDIRGDGWISGEFIEVIAPRRLVFTWGWEGGDDAPYPVPPGASTVEVELTPEGSGTRLRLTHRIEIPELEEQTRFGWLHYIERLAVRAEGRDPGPDPHIVGPIS